MSDAGEETTEAVTDITAVSALARLSAELGALQRQLDRQWEEIAQSEERSTRLTDAKFVTYRTLIDSQAAQVRLALEATDKAIAKAEVATGKAIDKQETANNDRFASVNEFRAQLSDLIAKFATLERVDLLFSQANQRIDEMSKNMSERIGDLTIRLTKIEEYSRGAQGNKAGIYAAIGAAVGLIAIIVFIANAITK